MLTLTKSTSVRRNKQTQRTDHRQKLPATLKYRQIKPA